MYYKPPPQPKKPYNLKLPKQYQFDQSTGRKRREIQYFFIRCWWLWPIITILCLMIAYMILMDEIYNAPPEDSLRAFYPLLLPAMQSYGLYMLLSLPFVLIGLRLNHKKNIRLQMLFPCLFTGAYTLVFYVDGICLIIFAICIMYTWLIVKYYKTILNESRLLDGNE